MPKILVIDDDRAIRHIVTEVFADTEHIVFAAPDVERGLEIVTENTPDVVLLDIELPEISGLEAYSKLKALDARLPVVYITAGGSSDTAIQATKLGALDYLLKPLSTHQLREAVAKAVELRRLTTLPVELSRTISPEDHGDQIIGRSPAMQEVFKAIGRVAPLDVTVLVRGESGTGKELIARAVYQHSERRGQCFLAVNCAAIPEQLLESELFGYEKGAFTGADRQRIGKFEQCDGGTIFLDEIGDMPLVLQGKVLRLLQQQEFQRVGGNTTIRTDVRIVAATNRDLEQMVAEGSFREDLLYRLNGFTIPLPPLRQRGEDLVLLIQHYVARISRTLNRKIDGVTPEAIEVLKSYRWPGNIRELEGVLRQCILRATGSVVHADLLPESICHAPTPQAPLPRFEPSERPADRGLPQLDLSQFVTDRLNMKTANLYAETVELLERYLLTRVLTLTSGNQSEASRVLGITRGSLRHKLRSLGITIESSIDPGF